MSNPLVHAERSARRWGGVPEDFQPVHQWFDGTKAHVADNRHRMILHIGFGIALADQVFGLAITNAYGRRVFVREIGLQDILEDLGFISTLEECLKEHPFRLLMAGARKLANCPAVAGNSSTSLVSTCSIDRSPAEASETNELYASWSLTPTAKCGP